MSEFWWLVYGYSVAILAACLILLLLYKGAARCARHTHDNGHCGYSGCQADLRRVR